VELTVPGTLTVDSSSVISVGRGLRTWADFREYGHRRRARPIWRKLRRAWSRSVRAIEPHLRLRPFRMTGAAAAPMRRGGLLQVIGGALRIDGCFKQRGDGAAGAGSGGAIYLEGPALTGTGSIIASGGFATSGAGGGGGRIAVYVRTDGIQHRSDHRVWRAKRRRRDGRNLQYPCYLRVLSTNRLGHSGHLMRPSITCCFASTGVSTPLRSTGRSSALTPDGPAIPDGNHSH